MGRHHTAWTVAITALALFMFALDRLIVTTALPQIGDDLGGGVRTLAWTVNAFTLAFAVLLLTGAALGDRFGRRRMFVTGIGLFTGAVRPAEHGQASGAAVALRETGGVLGVGVLAAVLSAHGFRAALAVAAAALGLAAVVALGQQLHAVAPGIRRVEAADAR